MRIAPLVRRSNRAVGLVLPGGSHVIGEWTGRTWSQVPAGAKLYCARKSDLFRMIRRGRGRMRVWRRHKVTSFELHSHRITNLRGVLGSVGGEDALGELIGFADWVRGNGGNIGSLSGSAWSLWRSSLGSVMVVYGDEPGFSELSSGGRQGEIEQRTSWSDVELWDLTAAYSFTIGRLAVPTAWRTHRELRTSIPPGEIGYAQAAVGIPSAAWGPLPTRPAPEVVVWPTGAEIDGVWSLDELRAAQKTGCEVIIRGMYGSDSHRYPFRRWWRMIEDGRRELTGGAARLLKAAANTLWGRFLTAGEAEWWSWPAGELVISADAEPRLEPSSPALAALVASRVRARLYGEALSVFDQKVIACHTDGVILPAGCHISPNSGAPGRWRVKDRATRLDLITAQSFRYRRPSGELVYRVSGVPESLAPGAFSAMIRPFRRSKPELPDDVGAWKAIVDAEQARKPKLPSLFD